MSIYLRSPADFDMFYKIDEKEVIWSYCTHDKLGWMQCTDQRKDRVKRMVDTYKHMTEDELVLELI